MIDLAQCLHMIGDEGDRHDANFAHSLRRQISNRPVQRRLEPFAGAGPYADILDANVTTLKDGSWQAFEMEALYNKPPAVAPTLDYLFHRLEKRFDGRPTLLVLDEAWLFLDDPLFADKIREWLKTLRRRNVSVVFASQSLPVLSSLAEAMNRPSIE